MREILYRARREDNGEWVHGTPYQEYDSFWQEWEWKIQTKHPLTNVPYMHLTVDRKTISQFTGLADKNHKKIFEGDIVVHHTIPMLVKWDEDSASFVVGYNMNEQYYENMLHGSGYLEVIGNVYDNPELLR
jgi:uncharacterized phage protein (TIGR01671 family)